MMTRPSDLPDFGSPPLNEVAISVQFDKLDQFRIVHAGPLWDRFRNEGDKVEYLPPIQPVFETFGVQRPGLQQIQLQFADGPELPRMWFVRQNASDLIQFQTDRFVHNWRKAGTGIDYPRYEKIRASFIDELQILETFVSDNELGAIRPNQCELTYVNVIKPTNGENVLTFAPPSSVVDVGDLEDCSVTLRYQMIGRDGMQIGRVVAQTMPLFDVNGERALQLSITGRGPPAEPTINSVMDFMDAARMAVVKTFARVTSIDMHKIWGRST